VKRPRVDDSLDWVEKPEMKWFRVVMDERRRSEERLSEARRVELMARPLPSGWFTEEFDGRTVYVNEHTQETQRHRPRGRAPRGYSGITSLYLF